MSETMLATQGDASAKPRLRDALTPHSTLIFGISLLSTVSRYMVQPFFIIYFKDTLGFSTPEAGLLVGLPFLAALLFGVIGGYLSDRIGVLKAYSIAMAVYAVAMGAIGFVHSFTVIIVLMLLMGLAMPVMSGGISSMVNESAQPEHRGLLQNYLYWINNVGIVLGLLVSAELLHAGHSNVPFTIVAGISLVVGVVSLTFFSRRKTEMISETPAGPRSPRPSMWATVKFAGSDKALLYTACTLLLLMIMESQVTSTIPLDLTDHFHDGSQLFGPLVAINSVIVIACQPLVVKWFAKKRPVPVFVAGVICTGIGLSLGGVFSTVVSWVIGMVFYSVGEVLWSSKINHLLGELPTPGNTALYFGMIGSAQNMAFFIGIVFGTTAYHVLSAPILFGSMIVLAILAALVFRLATSAYRRRSLLDLANSDSASQVILPGVEPYAEHDDAEKDDTHEVTGTIVQGTASFILSSSAHDDSVYGIPTRAERMTFLEGLSVQDWETIFTYTESHHFAAGEIVLEMGEADRSLFIVLTGQLEVLVPNKGDRTQYRRISMIDNGSVFGEQSFLDGRPRSATIRATTGGEMRKLDAKAFARLMQSDATLGQLVLTDLARIVSERLRQTTEYLNLLYSA